MILQENILKQMLTIIITVIFLTGCNKDAKKTVFDLGRKRPYTWDDFFFKTIETVLVQIKAHIDNAKFSYNFYPNPNLTPLKRQQSACRYCGYRLICRYSERF